MINSKFAWLARISDANVVYKRKEINCFLRIDKPKMINNLLQLKVYAVFKNR